MKDALRKFYRTFMLTLIVLGSTSLGTAAVIRAQEPTTKSVVSIVTPADAPVHNPDTDGNYVNAPANRGQADLLILHGGHYVMGRNHFLFEDDPLSVEAMNIGKHMGGRGWHRTFEDEGNGLTFIGAYNEDDGCAIGIEVSGKWTLSIDPIRYGCN